MSKPEKTKTKLYAWTDTTTGKWENTECFYNLGVVTKKEIVTYLVT